ncbi:TPA: restriction endonuclease subunit S [Citrobacter amalonaticus]
MAKYKAYPEYKDSGVEWLGEIPVHWRTISIARLFCRNKDTGHTEKELLSVYRDYGVIPKSSRDDNNNKPSEDLSPYQLVEPDDLVMNKMKAWQGSIAISEYEGIVSPAYFVYQPRKILFEQAYPRYVHYLLRNPIYVTQYLSRSKGIRVNQWDLDPDEFRNIEVLLPSKIEQSKIFSFLDLETAKIDNLIDKQQQLIELLKEKCQAMISHAVTKGLNPDVPMKDSGIEWLGEIPEDWNFSQVKYGYSITLGKMLQKEKNSYFDSFEPYLKAQNIQVSGLDLHSVDSMWFSREEKKKLLLEYNDILVSEGGDVGRSALWLGQMNQCYIQNAIHRVRPQKNNSATFFQYWITFLKLTDFINIICNKATIAHYTVEKLASSPLLLPKKNEQQQIADFLDHEIAKIDTLIDKQLLQIALLQERRTALISAAVTGKIDVRNWCAPSEHSQTTAETEAAV